MADPGYDKGGNWFYSNKNFLDQVAKLELNGVGVLTTISLIFLSSGLQAKVLTRSDGADRCAKFLVSEFDKHTDEDDSMDRTGKALNRLNEFRANAISTELAEVDFNPTAANDRVIEADPSSPTELKLAIYHRIEAIKSDRSANLRLNVMDELANEQREIATSPSQFVYADLVVGLESVEAELLRRKEILGRINAFNAPANSRKGFLRGIAAWTGEQIRKMTGQPSNNDESELLTRLNQISENSTDQWVYRSFDFRASTAAIYKLRVNGLSRETLNDLAADPNTTENRESWIRIDQVLYWDQRLEKTALITVLRLSDREPIYKRKSDSGNNQRKRDLEEVLLDEDGRIRATVRIY